MLLILHTLFGLARATFRVIVRSYDGGVALIVLLLIRLELPFNGRHARGDGGQITLSLGKILFHRVEEKYERLLLESTLFRNRIVALVAWRVVDGCHGLVEGSDRRIGFGRGGGF